MKKKNKYEEELTNDMVFSEIDVKETSFKKKNVELYSLNVLSDNSDNENIDNENSSDSDSIDLDDYDLDINTSDIESDIESDTTVKKSDKYTLNTNEFFKCLLEIDSKDKKLQPITENEEDEEDEEDEEKEYKVGYINDISDLINVTPEKLIVKKLNTDNENNKSELNETKSELNETKSELNETKSELYETKSELNETKNELKETKTKLETIEEKIEEKIEKLSETQNEINETIEKEKEKLSEILIEKRNIKELNDLNTNEKKDLYKSILTNNSIEGTSYNYLSSEIENIDNIINNLKLKEFYNIANVENKNIIGYIEDNEIYKCKIKKPYKYEVYTKINEDMEPPGNYINIFLKKNLDITKKIYLLQMSGCWILEPLENYNKYKNDINMKNILYIYFIILKLLYFNKYYPFDEGDLIKKYKNLTKNINLNLFNYIKKNENFNDYINNQLKTVFKLNESIDNIVNIIEINNINKYHKNILRLSYIKY